MLIKVMLKKKTLYFSVVSFRRYEKILNSKKMDFDLLPNELLRTVISYLDIKSAKQMSLVSKRMYSFALQRIWLKPRYSKPKDIDFLQKLSKFPIRELRTRDFECSWMEILYLVPQLKLLNIELPMDKYREAEIPLQSRLRFLRLPVIVHTSAFELTEQDHFDQLLKIVETINVKEMVIDSPSYNLTTLWSYDQLKMFFGKVHISKISVGCLSITKENAKDFFRMLSVIDCWITLSQPSEPCQYKFTVDDVKLMEKLNLKIIYIESRYLKTDEEISKLLEFAEVMRKMKHLKEFYFSPEEFDRNDQVFAPMELLTDLPIKYLYSSNFEFEKRHFRDIVNTLSRIKSLIGFGIYNDLDDDKLTPDELELFKDIPINNLDVDSLDLRKDNVDDFQNIMKGMKITDIEMPYCGYDDSLYDIKLEIKNVGPGGIYRTI
uniref:F-box domain-containing protein n=1 Tax=Clytia hemisphaerica TaxID=252671 RepID=A0A7M5VDP0_9CNID